MSGFEVFAAAIGVAELTLRSISRVYEFTKEIKDAPEQVARLRSELHQLTNCLSELALLAVEGSPARPVIQRRSLAEPLQKCGDTCSKLEASLRKWTEGGSGTAASRLRVRMNKSHIESAVKEIDSTKARLHFAVTIAHLTLQSDDMSHRTTTEAPAQNQSRTPDFLSPGAGYAEAPLVHQPRPTLTGNEERPAAQPAQQGSQASDGPEIIDGPEVKETYDTEIHDQQGNKQVGSPDATMGAPAHLSAQNFTMKDNNQTNSPRSKMGRY